jgi:hypothetical protein
MNRWTDRCGEAERHIFATFHCKCTRNEVVVVVGIVVVVVDIVAAAAVAVVSTISWLHQISVTMTFCAIASDKICIKQH